jgi:hypothetical protein
MKSCWQLKLLKPLERVKGIEPSYSAWKSPDSHGDKMGLSDTLMWRARAGQARRVAGMLSPRDAALLEAMRENAKTAPVQPLLKTLELIRVCQSRSVGTA